MGHEYFSYLTYSSYPKTQIVDIMILFADINH